MGSYGERKLRFKSMLNYFMKRDKMSLSAVMGSVKSRFGIKNTEVKPRRSGGGGGGGGGTAMERVGQATGQLDSYISALRTGAYADLGAARGVSKSRAYAFWRTAYTLYRKRGERGKGKRPNLKRYTGKIYDIRNRPSAVDAYGRLASTDFGKKKYTRFYDKQSGKIVRMAVGNRPYAQAKPFKKGSRVDVATQLKRGKRGTATRISKKAMAERGWLTKKGKVRANIPAPQAGDVRYVGGRLTRKKKKRG